MPSKDASNDPLAGEPDDRPREKRRAAPSFSQGPAQPRRGGAGEPPRAVAFPTALERAQARRARARADAYHAIALLLLPPAEELTEGLDSGGLSRTLDQAVGRLALGTGEALVDAVRALEGQTQEQLEQRHFSTFGASVGAAHPPYSTEYERDAGFRKEQELADIAGFYRAFGVGLADGLHERPDHLGIEADFLAFLSMKEALALSRGEAEHLDIVAQARVRFARDYVLPAARCFADRLAAEGRGEPFFAAAALLRELLVADAGSDAPHRRVVSLPVVHG